MKVLYEMNAAADLKAIKEALKPFGGRCAKVVDGKLEYQIKDDQEAAAFAALQAAGYLK